MITQKKQALKTLSYAGLALILMMSFSNTLLSMKEDPDEKGKTTQTTHFKPQKTHVNTKFEKEDEKGFTKSLFHRSYDREKMKELFHYNENGPHF